jgi:ribosome-associated protein
LISVVSPSGTREEVTHLSIEQTIGAAAAPQPRLARPMPSAETIAEAARKSLDDSKAEDIVIIDIHDKSSLADVMIVASGRSHRHVGAIADRLIDDLEKVGAHAPRVEGLPHCDWVLVDAGDVLINLFRPEVRGFYALEKMWSADAPAPRATSRG